MQESDFKRRFEEHIQVARRTEAELFSAFEVLLEACHQAVKSGKKILFFGNGGSAADSQHLATELAVRYKRNRPAVAALALTTDTSTLTAAGNDLGFEQIFSRQIEALCQPGDVVIGISTSGTSKNVIRGLEAARKKGAFTACLGGSSGGQIKKLVDCALIIPSEETDRIQEMHILVGHLLCEEIEQVAVASSR